MSDGTVQTALWRASILPLMLALAACSGEPPAPTATETPAAPKKGDAIELDAARLERIGIAFAPAEAATEIPLGTVPATVAPPPNARVAVAAIIPGVVTRTLVVEGETVRAGQPLAVVASRELYAMGAAIESASARVAVARANHARLGQLAREGVIAGARADEARAALREAEAALSEQRRVVALVNGQPRSGSYTLRAPIAGKVTGATIQTGSPVDGATAAYVIDAADRYELTAQLPAHMIGQVRPDMGVAIDGDVRGTVTSVASVVDPDTRSAALRARIPAAPGIVSGRVASATLLGPAPAGAVSVPTSAVVSIDGADTVFVRTANGVAARKVKGGGASGGRTVVLAGLKPGEQVAIAGASELKSLAGGQ